MTPVYITRLSKFFPNDPVSNDDMEKVLGMIAGKPSRARTIVLRNNGIKNRYYALKDGKVTHTNAQLATIAIKALFNEQHPIEKLELLAAGTSSPEQVLPSHAAMIHGELGIHSIEIVSTSGACATSMQALKYAFMSIAGGLVKMAAVAGSERFSSWKPIAGRTWVITLTSLSKKTFYGGCSATAQARPCWKTSQMKAGFPCAWNGWKLPLMPTTWRHACMPAR